MFKEKSYKFRTNLKNSVKAIEKMNREIERHPENKPLLNRTVEGVLENQKIKNFKIVFCDRKTFEDTTRKNSIIPKISYKTESLYSFSCIEEKEGKDYFLQNDIIEDILKRSKRGTNGFIKIAGCNEDGELILFIINNNVPLTKEEKRIVKEFFE